MVAGGAGSPRRRNLRERAPVPEKKPAPLALGSSDEDDEDDDEEEEDEGDEYNVSEEEEEEETTNGQKKKEEQKRDKEKEEEKKKSANRRPKAKANGKAKELAKPAKGNNKKKTAALFHRACLKHLVPEDHCEVPERLSATIQARLHPFLLVADHQCNQPSDTHTHHHTHHRTRAVPPHTPTTVHRRVARFGGDAKANRALRFAIEGRSAMGQGAATWPPS